MTLEEAFSTLKDGNYIKRKSDPFSLKRLIRTFRESIQDMKNWANPPQWWKEDMMATDWECIE